MRHGSCHLCIAAYASKCFSVLEAAVLSLLPGMQGCGISAVFHEGLKRSREGNSEISLFKDTFSQGSAFQPSPSVLSWDGQGSYRPCSRASKAVTKFQPGLYFPKPISADFSRSQPSLVDLSIHLVGNLAFLYHLPVFHSLFTLDIELQQKLTHAGVGLPQGSPPLQTMLPPRERYHWSRSPSAPGRVQNV